MPSIATSGINANFHDDDFQLGLETVLAGCYRRAADIDEVVVTARRIIDGDPDSWLDEWMATAGAVWSAAVQAQQTGRRPAAVTHYRRAATYYAAALHRVVHSREPERQLAIWRRQRACWERTVDLSPVPGQRIAIPYDDKTLPGFFFPAADALPGERRPLVIVNNGLDVPTSQTWVRAGAAASERGYHWMTFDGPGQQAALYEQGIPSRPDWEAVLTPVLDVLLRRPDVDPQRVAVIGLDQGGYWVPRALWLRAPVRHRGGRSRRRRRLSSLDAVTRRTHARAPRSRAAGAVRSRDARRRAVLTRPRGDSERSRAALRS